MTNCNKCSVAMTNATKDPSPRVGTKFVTCGTAGCTNSVRIKA